MLRLLSKIYGWVGPRVSTLTGMVLTSLNNLSGLFAVQLVSSLATMGVRTRPSSLVTRCRTPLFGEIDQPGYDLEAGLSVIEPYRRKGLAAALLCRAARYARSRGLKTLDIHCLAENTPMLSLARRLGMTIEMSQSEADGRLKLRAGTAPS